MRRPAFLAFSRACLLAAVLPVAALAAPARLPVIAGTEVAGQPLRIDPAARDVVLVHYWATWCAPCRAEMPVLDRAAKALPIRIVGIALDAGASRAKVRAGSSAVAFPLVRVADSTLPARLVPSSIPQTDVYGRDGTLRYRFRDGRMIDDATLARILPPLLAER